MAEADVINLSHCFPSDMQALDKVLFNTRLLPIQVLGRRATSSAYKYRALLRMLNLEVGDTALAKGRTRSFLNDMGVESKLSLLPELDMLDAEAARRAFPHTLPLHDLDHGMHHVMQEIVDGCWPGEMGQLFDKQLNALSKYFSKRDNSERFCKFRIWDSNMPLQAKRTLSKIMMHTCPTFVPHRWQYRFEVLSWLCEREQLLMMLDPASVQTSRHSSDDDFTDMDVEALKLLYTDVEAATLFWTLAYTMKLLCRWGHKVVGWLHGCWCNPSMDKKHSCGWKGRRMIELACGGCGKLTHLLRQTALEHDRFASGKFMLLQQTNPATAQLVKNGFATAKQMLEGRFLQLSSFLQQLSLYFAKRFVCKDKFQTNKQTNLQVKC